MHISAQARGMCVGRLTLVLAPLAVTRRLVVDASQEVEVLERHLLLLDTELVFQLPLGGVLDTKNGIWQVGTRLVGHVQGVGAASVGPHVGEGNLLRGALLQEQLVVTVEEKNRESPVEETLVDVRHEVAWLAGVLLLLVSMPGRPCGIK